MPRRSLAISILLFGTVMGCKPPTYVPSTDLPSDDIVSDGPAPASVTLTRIPPQGATQTVHFTMQVQQPGMRRKDISSMQMVNRIESVTPAYYVESTQISGFQMLRNDFGIDAEKQRRAMDNVRTQQKMSRRGDFLSGTVGDAAPLSYHLPDRPLHAGETWMGWSGIGAKKEAVEFSLAGIIHSKGHDLAVISYAYTSIRSSVISVTEWTDVDSGWTMKSERTERESYPGRTLVTTYVTCDPLYEH